MKTTWQKTLKQARNLIAQKDQQGLDKLIKKSLEIFPEEELELRRLEIWGTIEREDFSSAGQLLREFKTHPDLKDPVIYQRNFKLLLRNPDTIKEDNIAWRDCQSRMTQLYKAGQFDEIIKFIEEAKVNFPYEIRFILNHEIQSLMQLGKLDEAASVIERYKILLPEANNSYEGYENTLRMLRGKPENFMRLQRAFSEWDHKFTPELTEPLWNLVLEYLEVAPEDPTIRSYLGVVGAEFIGQLLKSGQIARANEIHSHLPASRFERELFTVSRKLIADGFGSSATPLLLSLMHEEERPEDEIVILALSTISNTNNALGEIWGGVSRHFSEEEFREFRRKAHAITQNPLLVLSDQFNYRVNLSSKIFHRAEYSVYGAIDRNAMMVTYDPRFRFE